MELLTYKTRFIFSFYTDKLDFIKKNLAHLHNGVAVVKAQPTWIMGRHLLDYKFMRTVRRPEDNRDIQYIFTFSENTGLVPASETLIIMEIDCQVEPTWVHNFVIDGEFLPQKAGSANDLLGNLIIGDFMDNEIEIDCLKYTKQDGYQIFGIMKEPLTDTRMEDKIKRANE